MASQTRKIHIEIDVPLGTHDAQIAQQITAEKVATIFFGLFNNLSAKFATEHPETGDAVLFDVKNMVAKWLDSPTLDSRDYPTFLQDVHDHQVARLNQLLQDEVMQEVESFLGKAQP